MSQILGTPDTDERVWSAYCRNLGGRFITTFKLLRDGELADYMVDHGPEDPRVPPTLLVTYLEHPFGEVFEAAEAHYNDLRWWKHVLDLKAQSTVLIDVVNQEDARRLIVQNKSVLGPYVRHQRNNQNPQAAERAWNDERRRRTGKKVFAT